MFRPTVVLASLLWTAGIAASAAAASDKPAPATVKTVVIDHFQFQPDALEVHAGDTVEWKNDDIVPHTVTAADSKSFDSGPIASGASWRFTAPKKGTYDYLCTLHPNMKAKLIVQ